MTKQNGLCALFLLGDYILVGVAASMRVYLYVCECVQSYLCAFGGRGTHGSAQHLLDDVWQQADGDEQDDAEPGGAAGQHLHEHVVHPLVVQEGPAGGDTAQRDGLTRLQGTRYSSLFFE